MFRNSTSILIRTAGATALGKQSALSVSKHNLLGVHGKMACSTKTPKHHNITPNDLANEISMAHGLSKKHAHGIVDTMVRQLLAGGNHQILRIDSLVSFAPRSLEIISSSHEKASKQETTTIRTTGRLMKQHPANVLQNANHSFSSRRMASTKKAPQDCSSNHDSGVSTKEIADKVSKKHGICHETSQDIVHTIIQCIDESLQAGKNVVYVASSALSHARLVMLIMSSKVADGNIESSNGNDGNDKKE